MFGWLDRKIKQSAVSRVAAADTNQHEQLTAWQREADALLEAKQYAAARVLYERILASCPTTST